MLSVAEEQLLANNSDVTEMVKDLIAMNVVTQNIKVTGEALINSAIIAELTLGNTQNPNSGTIKSHNYSAGSSGFRLSADGTFEAQNAVIRGEINATSGSFSNVTIDGSCTIGGKTPSSLETTSGAQSKADTAANNALDSALAAFVGSGNVRDHTIIDGGKIISRLIDVDAIKATTGFFYNIDVTGNINSYKSVNPSTGDLAISMGVNPKNESDDIINLNVQSYCGKVQYNASGRTYYNEIWKKELYTKNNGIDTDININGNLVLSGGISSFSPDLYAGAYFSNLKLNAAVGLSLNNYNSAYLYNNGYIYLFQSSTFNPSDLLVCRAEYSENMTFEQIGLVSSIGIVRDAILYKKSMYVATDTGVYRVTYYHNEVYTTDITTTYKPKYLSIINGLLNLTYNNSGFVFYDGTNFTTKSVPYSVPYNNLCEFTDGIYTTSVPSVLESGGQYMSDSLVCFFDKNLNFIGGKYIDTGKLILEDGTEKSINASSSIFSACGKLFTILQYNDGGTVKITFAVSEDAGNTWHKIDGVDISFLGFRFFSYKNAIVIKDQGEYIYSVDGGKSFTEIDNEGYSSARNGSAFVFTTKDGIYQDIIIPSSIPVIEGSYYYNVNFDRIRQTNIAKGIVANNGTAYSHKGNMTMANGLKIQWGRVEKGSNLAANSTWSGTVTFDVPFTSKYYVTTVGIDTTDTTSGHFAGGIETAIKQGTDSFEFQCYCRNSSSTSYQPVLNWVAIGY